MASQPAKDTPSQVDIKPLLTKLWPNTASVTPEEIADAISHFFTNQVTEAQTASLLMALHFTGLDYRADVLARSAYVMRQAAAAIPVKELQAIIEQRGKKEGKYNGGLVRQNVQLVIAMGTTDTNAPSVILLAPEAIHTTRSTSAPPHLSLPLRSCWSPSMETRLAPQSQVVPTCSTQ